MFPTPHPSTMPDSTLTLASSLSAMGSEAALDQGGRFVPGDTDDVPPPPPTLSCPKGSHGGSKKEKRRSPLHRWAELSINLHIQPSKRQREATQLPQSIS